MMLEKSSLLEQRLIDCLNLNYGIEVMTLIFLPLGSDMHAFIYKAQARDQSSYFVKLNHGHASNVGALIIDLLHEAGIPHVIPIIKTRQGHFQHYFDDFTIIVFPFIEGKDGFSRKLNKEQWVTFGKTMRQIHEINLPLTLQSLIRRETYTPKWRQAVRALYSIIESKPSGDEIALKLLNFMKTHQATIHCLVNRAEQLAQQLQNQTVEFVLCHADIHGGNVLIGENDIFYIVDWDAPLLAPKERDLMFIGGGVANVWNNPWEEELFYQGYGKSPINKILLAYYRHERIIEDIALYGQQLLLTAEGGKGRQQWYDELAAQFEPQGVVEIAFKTDEGLLL